MIYDSFPYAGESICLRIRLEELKDTVSYFIILESNKTQTGLDKPYYFEQQKEEFKDFADKIVYVKLDDTGLDKVKEADWSQEFSVRKAVITHGFPELQKRNIEISDGDYLLINDVDEIPRAEVIKQLVDIGWDLISLNHYFNSYYLNLVSYYRRWGWFGSILCRVGLLRKHSVQELRNVKDHLSHTGNSGEGWHFSNLLINGFDTMYNKWTNNIEPHNKSCLLNKELLKEQFEKCLYQDRHFFYCDQPDRRDIPLEELSVDLLPKYIKNNLSKYQDLLYYYESPKS